MTHPRFARTPRPALHPALAGLPLPAAVFLAAALILPAAPAAACEAGDAEAYSVAVPAIYLEDLVEDPESATGVPGARTEETVAVRPGARLQVGNYAGEIVVRAAGGNQVRVLATHSGRDQVVVKRVGSKVVVECQSRRVVPGAVYYEISVPEWMDLDLNGVNADITVEGVNGDVKAATVQGDVALVKARGPATLSTVTGDVSATQTRGRIEASSVNGSVRIIEADGSVLAESVNGNIELEGVTSDSIDASTVNGPVRFIGRILDRGLYRLASHNGSIRVAVPEDASARVFVSTYHGGFGSTFPVKTQETKKGRRYVLLLGAGSAQMTLETFQGRVFLFRPGEEVADDENEHEHEEDGAGDE